MSAPIPTIVYLDRDKLSFCDSKSGLAQTFTFPAGAIRDLEVKNYPALTDSLKLFLTQHKFSPTHLVFILSASLCFEKNLAKLSEEQRTAETQKFLDTIPFDTISSKLFHTASDYKLVAINGDFYQSFRAIFEQLGFVVSAACPISVLGSLGVKPEFTPESCRILSKKVEFLYENSFVAPQTNDQSLIQKRRHFLRSHSALFAILSLLSVLIAGVTAFVTLRRPLSTRPANLPIVSFSPSITLTPSLVPTTAPPASVSADLTVQILAGSKSQDVGRQITTELTALGLTNIIQAQSSTLGSKVLVIYSPRVPSDLRLHIQDILLDHSASPSAQENPSTKFDITINI